MSAEPVWRLNALAVAREHIGWCLYQGQTLREIGNAIGITSHNTLTFDGLIHSYATVWRAMTVNDASAAA